MNIAEKLTTIAENEPKIYEAGKKSQYDEFWDNFQNKGLRTKYGNAFCSFENNIYFWNDTNFKPKYDLKPTGSADSMFRSMKIADFSSLFEELGIILDVSKVTSFNDAFYYTNTNHIGELDLSSCSSMNFAFLGCKAITIDKLIIKDGVSVNNTFMNTDYLENIIIEGVISKTWNMQWCPLSKDSIISVINALGETTSNLTVTFKKTAINNAFGIDIDDETTYPEGSEYYTLRNTKSNWTFNYV